MKNKELREKNNSELKNQLILCYKEKIKLLIDKSSGAEFTKNHLFKKNKKNIARILTIIKEKKHE